MIFYNDFDRRITHVMCDHCEADMTAAARRAIQPKPFWRRIIFPGWPFKDSLVMRGQRSITLFGYDIVFTLFKSYKQHPAIFSAKSERIS